MLRIAHTADVHIRALSRHDEYRQILKKFTEDCSLQKVDHIFIGGDIFHTKTTGISPEYIDLLTWWLNDMSKVAEVHMILGNHDGNLVNLSRQDAVTPIVEAMNNPRVHLYKKSGVYQFSEGYNWCIFSCFDEEGWTSVKPTQGEINIAAFHGPVRGSSTETGWDVEEGTTSDFFNDYDFCLLGDIHKPQALGYRSGKPWIAYPGTPIQQNYAEQREHGYLLWTIRSKDDWDVQTRSLPNLRPFITLDWSGDLDEVLTEAKNSPKGTRFRIRSQTQIPQDTMYHLSETLKASMSASEVTYKLDYHVDKHVVKAGTSTLSKTDLRSPDVVVKLLKDYYKNDISTGDIESITEHVKSYLGSVKSDEDAARGSKWSLRHMKWDNLFSYGEDNTVNFDKLKGIVGIFGPNRTGKSSVVGTLMYTLFNTTDRGPMKNINVCNVRKTYCSGRVILDHDGTSYVIERQTTKSANKKGIVTATTALNLFRMRDDGELDDLSGEQRNDTEKSVKALLGSPEDFLMTSLSAQGESNQFIAQGSSKRRSILTRFLDLDVFDRLHDLASKEVSSYKAQLKNFPDRNWDELSENSAAEKRRLTKLISDLSESISENQTMLDVLRQDLSSHNASPVTTFDVEAQRRRVDDLKTKSDECAGNIARLEEEVESLQQKLDAVQQIVDSVDLEDLKKRLDRQKKLEASILVLRHAYEKESGSLNQHKKSIKILDDVPCGDEYPTCKFIKDAHISKGAYASQEKKTSAASKVLEDAQKALAAVQDDTLLDKISKQEKASSLVEKIKLEISRKETEIARLKSSCDACLEGLNEAKKRLKTLEEAVINEENEEVVSVRAKIKELSDRSKRLDLEKMDAASQMGRLTSVMEKLLEEKKVRDDLLAKARTHDLISNAFSKKGIPLLVTKSQLPVINAEVAKILQGIVDFTIEMESDEDTDSLEIYINYGDSRRIIELCSGMEKTISAIALRVAMINISSLPKPDFFVIDEGFGTLDSSGVEACSRLLVALKRHFNSIIVITHVDGIKDSADHILEITKNEKDSKLECA